MSKTSASPHAVLVSSPGMGHLTPILGLANRLSTLHSFKVTILFVSSRGASHAPLRGNQYSSNVNLLNIPAADISNMVDPGAHVVTQICVFMRATAPSVRSAILDFVAPRPTVLILDMFATDYLPIARELALPSLVFVDNAWCLAYLTRCRVFDKEVQGDYIDHPFPLEIPGFRPVRPEDVMEPTARRNQPQYTEFLRIGAQIPLFDGVLIRTWEDVERSALAALRGRNVLPVPIYDIGPIIVAEPYGSSDESDTMLMEWLDRQPPHSVLYVSFGSGGALSTKQTNEVALGLELSQQRFIWVVRPPMDGDASGTYLGLKGDVDNIDSYMPHGFRERTHDVGRLVLQWAPQSKVLAHPSVGGFLTHCGWNSIMESLSRGVPMMAWPMYAEQRMNATLIVEELNVSVRTCGLPGKILVGREDIGKTVRILMEGEEGLRLRLRAKELQIGASLALTPNGSSSNRLSELVETLKMWKVDNA